ncbi:hypothetical protein BJX64DRAFT_257009 [Aspergillus heterothallicus]
MYVLTPHTQLLSDTWCMTEGGFLLKFVPIQGVISFDDGAETNNPLRRGIGGSLDLPVYVDITINHNPVYPVHDFCYQNILRRCITGSSEGGVLDEDALYKVFKSRGSRNSLALSYGAPWPEHEQFWTCEKGKESLVADPIHIPELLKTLDVLKCNNTSPVLEATMREPVPTIENGHEEARARHRINHDPFTNLPIELRLMVLSSLPAASILALRAASPSFQEISIPATLWRDALENSLPWLWEFQEYESPFQTPRKEKWFYNKLLEAEAKSTYREGEPGTYIGGLVNRRRIWGVCEQIKEYYLKYIKKQDGEEAM